MIKPEVVCFTPPALKYKKRKNEYMEREGYKYRVAVATSDGLVVNRHFGKAECFLIIDVDTENQMHPIETRDVAPICQGGNHDDNRLEETAKLLEDCKYVLVSRIGQGAAYTLERFGIVPMELPGMINIALDEVAEYDELQNLF